MNMRTRPNSAREADSHVNPFRLEPNGERTNDAGGARSAREALSRGTQHQTSWKNLYCPTAAHNCLFVSRAENTPAAVVNEQHCVRANTSHGETTLKGMVEMVKKATAGTASAVNGRLRKYYDRRCKQLNMFSPKENKILNDARDLANGISPVDAFRQRDKIIALLEPGLERGSQIFREYALKLLDVANEIRPVYAFRQRDRILLILENELSYVSYGYTKQEYEHMQEIISMTDGMTRDNFAAVQAKINRFYDENVSCQPSK